MIGGLGPVQSAKVIFWLGKLDMPTPGSVGTGEETLPPAGGIDRDTGSGRAEDGPAVLLDRQLIDRVLNLCDLACLHFDQRGDREAQVYFDRFAIMLVALIGAYFAERGAVQAAAPARRPT